MFIFNSQEFTIQTGKELPDFKDSISGKYQDAYKYCLYNEPECINPIVPEADNILDIMKFLTRYKEEFTFRHSPPACVSADAYEVMKYYRERIHQEQLTININRKVYEGIQTASANAKEIIKEFYSKKKQYNDYSGYTQPSCLYKSKIIPKILGRDADHIIVLDSEAESPFKRVFSLLTGRYITLHMQPDLYTALIDISGHINYYKNGVPASWYNTYGELYLHGCFMFSADPDQYCYKILQPKELEPYQVNHKDSILTNFNSSNLEIITKKSNQALAKETLVIEGRDYIHRDKYLLKSPKFYISE